MRLLILVPFLCALWSGCTARTGERSAPAPTVVYFALSTPGYEKDWDQIRESIQGIGIKCIDGPSDLGVVSLLVPTGDFDHARFVAINLVAQNALTVRIRSRSKSWSEENWEVWEHGKKIREESYLIKAK